MLRHYCFNHAICYTTWSYHYFFRSVSNNIRLSILIIISWWTFACMICHHRDTFLPTFPSLTHEFHFHTNVVERTKPRTVIHNLWRFRAFTTCVCINAVVATGAHIHSTRHTIEWQMTKRRFILAPLLQGRLISDKDEIVDHSGASPRYTQSGSLIPLCGCRIIIKRFPGICASGRGEDRRCNKGDYASRRFSGRWWTMLI